MGDFSNRVFEVVRRIPRGRVASYGQVGRLIGAPRSARYVGYALHANPDPGAEVNNIPCHRVVFKDGGLCKGFAFGGPEIQREMLEAEGVTFADDTHVDMDTCQWDGYAGDPNDEELPTAPPEVRLAELQMRRADSGEPGRSQPSVIGTAVSPAWRAKASTCSA